MKRVVPATCFHDMLVDRPAHQLARRTCCGGVPPRSTRFVDSGKVWLLLLPGAPTGRLT